MDLEGIDNEVHSLESVTTFPHWPYQLRDKKPDGLFLGPDFFMDLNSYRDRRMAYVDVLTYTASQYAPLRIKLGRLLMHKGDYLPCREARTLFSHIKLYIVYAKRGGLVVPIVAYIGSQNLVAPTIPEMMVKVPKTWAKFCANLFNYYWEVAKPKKGKR